MIYRENLTNVIKNRDILIQEKNFAYILPCSQLRNFISNFTISFPDKSIISDNYTVMPHGSVTLVLFYHKDVLHSFLFGPATKPVKVGDIANKCDVIFIIEFQPAGFFPFINTTQNQLTNKIVPFATIDYALDTEFRDIFKTSLSINELFAKFEKKLMQSIGFQYPKELASAVKTIIEAEGIMTAVQVSNDVFYCPRHLNRLFNLYLGMSIKSFARLVRINKSIKLLNDDRNTLALICEKLKYYDVSHFVKDFKRICGVTPQEYKTNMSDFYSEIAKF